MGAIPVFEYIAIRFAIGLIIFLVGVGVGYFIRSLRGETR